LPPRHWPALCSPDGRDPRRAQRAPRNLRCRNRPALPRDPCHAACRARSRREFIAKLGIAAEETEESVTWLKLCLRAGLATTAEVGNLYREGQELLAILGASRATAARNYERDTGKPIDAARKRESR
jgi:23S rRNA-intervening sequence protein